IASGSTRHWHIDRPPSSRPTYLGKGVPRPPQAARSLRRYGGRARERLAPPSHINNRGLSPLRRRPRRVPSQPVPNFCVSPQGCTPLLAGNLQGIFEDFGLIRQFSSPFSE